MHELTSDELLSAYLDGELTAAEQARAERLLTESAEARRLFEDLRGMRSCLQELPRQKLDDDFFARVLQRTEGAVVTAPAARVDRSEEATAPSSAPGWQERIRRPLAYAAIVLAASVLIAIFNPIAPPRENPQDSVALATRPAPSETAAPESTWLAPAMPGMSAPPASGDAPSRAEAEPLALGKQSDALKSNAEGEDPPAVAKRGPTATAALGGRPSDSRSGLQADAGLLVVTCEITPTAARQDAFRQVLFRNQINLGETREEQNAQTPPANPAGDAQEKMQRRAAEPGLEMVYVEASPEQLEATLAEMAAQPAEFLSVEVGAAKTQSLQNRWQEQYSRGRGGLTQQRSLSAPLHKSEAAKTLLLAPTAAEPPAPSATTTLPARPEAQTLDESGLGQSAPRYTQNPSRARSYAMPAEGLSNARSKSQVMLQQQVTPVPGERGIAKAGEKKGDAGPAEPTNPAGQAAAENYNPEATLRALFVLRVTGEQAPTAPAPVGSPAQKAP